MPAKLLAVALAGLFGASSACGGSDAASPPRVCAAEARTTLLEVTLDAWAVSPPFTVAAKTTTWVTVTKLPMEYDGLFGHINGVADLHTIPAGEAPIVETRPDGNRDSKDPSIVLQQDGWQTLSLRQGSWQVYTAQHQLGIRVVSCPVSR